MLFNSIDFFIFLPIVFLLYWFVFKSLKTQNVFLLLTSYLFYGWWDWRFLVLIFFSTCIDFWVSYYLSKENNKTNRKFLLYISLLTNLGLLGIFKYYNFFIENFNAAFTFFGSSLALNSLNLLIPVGISFYTFQTLSYTLDIYHKKLKPTPSFIEFSAFVSFFPQLVAGPIERANHFLPQFKAKRIFNSEAAKDGLRQMLWGLFKKIVIADNCAVLVDALFANPDAHNGSTLLIGAILFSFQIYCDFSGYTDIAIGCARLFGFNLNKNFNFPYFAKNSAEFWRRWHISLTTWFRDYIYIPLGGSKTSTLKTYRNIFIVFMVSAFWHGANWTFIIWGLIHVCLFLVFYISKSISSPNNNTNKPQKIPLLKSVIAILTTFSFTTLAWVFFRAESVQLAVAYLKGIASKTLFDMPNFNLNSLALKVIGLIGFLIVIEWNNKSNNHALETLFKTKHKLVRWGFYYVLIFMILYFYGDEKQFIYFQF